MPRASRPSIGSKLSRSDLYGRKREPTWEKKGKRNFLRGDAPLNGMETRRGRRKGEKRANARALV